jgi:hypothetical protein
MVNLDAFIVMVAAPSSVLPGWIDAPRDGCGGCWSGGP